MGSQLLKATKSKEIKNCIRNQKYNNHKDGLIVCLIYMIILSNEALPVTSASHNEISTPPFVIKDIVNQVHEILDLSSELQPVVDLVQIIKRPLSFSSKIFQVQNASRLAFGEAPYDIRSTLFFMLGHKSGLHDPFSSIFVDISVTSVIAFDPSTSKVELIPFQGHHNPNIHFVTSGKLGNCNIKLKQQQKENKQEEIQLPSMEVEEESGEIKMSVTSSPTYFQIRKLGSTMLK